MRFFEALPYLEAGRRVRHDDCTYRLDENGILMLCRPGDTDMPARSAKLTWTDWVVEEPAPAKPATKECGSVAPSCDWVCSEPRGHAGRHGRRDANATMSWPNLPELNATIVEQRATIARLTREREALLIDVKHADAQALELAHDVERLRREREEALRRLAEAGPKQCKRDLHGTAWVCTLPANHQGSHANSFGTWRT